MSVGCGCECFEVKGIRPRLVACWPRSATAPSALHSHTSPLPSRARARASNAEGGNGSRCPFDSQQNPPVDCGWAGWCRWWGVRGRAAASGCVRLSAAASTHRPGPCIASKPLCGGGRANMPSRTRRAATDPAKGQAGGRRISPSNLDPKKGCPSPFPLPSSRTRTQPVTSCRSSNTTSVEGEGCGRGENEGRATTRRDQWPTEISDGLTEPL